MTRLTPAPADLPTRSLPSRALAGRLRVPGDKSTSHRALMLGGLAEGTSRVSGLLEAGDVMSTLGAMRALGARIEREGGFWRVEGAGRDGLRSPGQALDLGNAGTGARLLMGLVAGAGLSADFVGDASLSVRPMERVLGPLRDMGADCASESGHMPVRVSGRRPLAPIAFAPPKASAQVKSAILLAGLGADGTTTVIERTPTRDNTERMLRAFGVPVREDRRDDGLHVSVDGPAELRATDIDVPGDPSSAAFAVVAATVVPGSEIVVENVLLDPRRDAWIDALRLMGADIRLEAEREAGGARVGDIHVRHAELSGATIDPGRAPDMIDEYPVLAVAAAFADGPTVMEGLHELRVKESDRLSTTVALLRANGVEVEERDDGMTVHGVGRVPGGGRVATHHDHRIAMSALVLGMGAENSVEVDDPSPIATSYPGFFEGFEALGARFA